MLDREQSTAPIVLADDEQRRDLRQLGIAELQKVSTSRGDSKDEAKDGRSQSKELWRQTRESEDRLYDQVRRVEAQYRDLEVRYHEQQEKLKQMENRLAHERQVSKDLEKRLVASVQLHGNAQALLESRTLELQEAQQYFAAPDNISDAEVMQSIHQLNGEIFQVAAALADSVQQYHSQTRGSFDEQNPSHQTAEHLVGRSLTELLIFKTHFGDPVCIQLAIQAAINLVVRWAIMAWDLTKPYSVGGIMGSICKGIEQAETQRIFASWRVLARRHAASIIPRGRIEDWLNAEVHSHIADIFGASGVHFSPQVSEDTRKRYEGQIHSIIARALDIRESIGEKIVSSNMKVIFVKEGGAFEVDRMEDEFGDNETTPSDLRDCKVLSTMALGLERVIAGDGTRGRSPRRVVLLKAKIVLDSVQEELEKDERAQRASS